MVVFEYLHITTFSIHSYINARSLSPLQHELQLSTLPFSRRSELIQTISAAAGLMGNDHILSLRTGDALVQRRAPALGRRICVPG